MDSAELRGAHPFPIPQMPRAFFEDGSDRLDLSLRLSLGGRSDGDPEENGSREENSGDTGKVQLECRLSRDQAWQAVQGQNSDAVLEPMAGARSLPVQVLATLVSKDRVVSRQESVPSYSQVDSAMADILRRKELQAQRRQVARRRRRALLEEKLQKKTKLGNGFESNACITRIPSFDSAFSDKAPGLGSAGSVLHDQMKMPLPSLPPVDSQKSGIEDIEHINNGNSAKQCHMHGIFRSYTLVEDEKKGFESLKACYSTTSSEGSRETREAAIAAPTGHKQLEASSYNVGSAQLIKPVAVTATPYQNVVPILPVAYPVPVPFGLMHMQFSMPYLMPYPQRMDNLHSVPESLDPKSMYGYTKGCQASSSADSIRKCYSSKESQSGTLEGKKGEVFQPVSHPRDSRENAKAAAKAPRKRCKPASKKPILRQHVDDGHGSFLTSKKEFERMKALDASSISDVRVEGKDGTRQDNESGESQVASEHSVQDGRNIQQGLAQERQTSAACTPNLHWVSTSGTGPNGKTITGVMYISTANRRQVRLVCSCHGKNMSAAEFVRHAGIADLSNPERNIVVNPFPILSARQNCCLTLC